MLMYVWTPTRSVIIGQLPSTLWMSTLPFVLPMFVIHSRSVLGTLARGGNPDRAAAAPPTELLGPQTEGDSESRAFQLSRVVSLKHTW